MFFKFRGCSVAPNGIRDTALRSNCEKCNKIHTAACPSDGRTARHICVQIQGFLWLATRSDAAGVWNQAGGSFATEYGGLWDDEESSSNGGAGDEGEREGEHNQGGEPGERRAASQDREGRQAAVASVGDNAGGSDAGDDDDAGSNVRRNELVFIGLGMDEDALKAELQLCLLTDEEMAGGPEGWEEKFVDPFPSWE